MNLLSSRLLEPNEGAPRFSVAFLSPEPGSRLVQFHCIFLFVLVARVFKERGLQRAQLPRVFFCSPQVLRYSLFPVLATLEELGNNDFERRELAVAVDDGYIRSGLILDSVELVTPHLQVLYPEFHRLHSAKPAVDGRGGLEGLPAGDAVWVLEFSHFLIEGLQLTCDIVQLRPHLAVYTDGTLFEGESILRHGHKLVRLVPKVLAGAGLLGSQEIDRLFCLLDLIQADLWFHYGGSSNPSNLTLTRP
jgi:hypothetical protein